jgi:hypothetical protein
VTIRKVTTLTSGLVTLAELRTGQTFIGKTTVRTAGIRAQDVSGILIPKATLADTALIRAANLVDARDNIIKIIREILGIGSGLGLQLGKPVLDVVGFTDVIELFKRTAPERSFDDAVLLDDLIALLIQFNRDFNDDAVLDSQLALLLDRHLSDELLMQQQISFSVGVVKDSAPIFLDQLAKSVTRVSADAQDLQSQLALNLDKVTSSEFSFIDAAQTLAGITRASEIIVSDLQALSNSIRLRDNTEFVSQLAKSVGKTTADLQLVASRPSLQPGPGLSDTFALVSQPISWFLDKVLSDEQPVPDFIGVFDGLNYSFAFAVQDRPVMQDVFSRSFNRRFVVELDVTTLDLAAKLLAKPVTLLVNVGDVSTLKPNLGPRDDLVVADQNQYRATKKLNTNFDALSQQRWTLTKPASSALLPLELLSKQIIKTSTSEYVVEDLLIVKPGKQFDDNAIIDQTLNRQFIKGNQHSISELDQHLLGIGKSLAEFLYTIGDVTPALPVYNTYARNSIPVASRFGVSIDNTNLFVENNQSAGRFLFTGLISPRVLTLQPLPAATENTLDITLIAGTVSAVNGLEQPDAGEDLVLQYSTDAGTTWTTSCTLWAGGTDWIGTVGLNGTYTTSVVFTSVTPVNLSWRIIQTNFTNPGFDQYAVVNISAPRSGAVNSMVLQDFVLITDILTGPIEPRVYILDRDRRFFDKALASESVMLDILQFFYNYEFLGDAGTVNMLDQGIDFLIGKDLQHDFALASQIAFFFDKVLADDQPALDLVGVFDGLTYASIITRNDDINIDDLFTRAWLARPVYEDAQQFDSRITNFDATLASFPFKDTQSFGSFVQLFKAVLRSLEETVTISDVYQDVIAYNRQFPIYSLDSEFGIDYSNIVVGTTAAGVRASGDPGENLRYTLSLLALQDVDGRTVTGWGTSITRNARSPDWIVAGDPTIISPRLLHPTTTQSRAAGAELENFSYLLNKTAKLATVKTVAGWGTSISGVTSSGDFIVIGDPSTTSTGQSRRSGSTLERLSYDAYKDLKTTATEALTNLIWDQALPKTLLDGVPEAITAWSPNWRNNARTTAVNDTTTADTVAHRLSVPIYWNSSQTATITAAGVMGLRTLTTGSLAVANGRGYYGPFDLGFDYNIGGAKYRHVVVGTDGNLFFNSSLTSLLQLSSFSGEAGTVPLGLPHIGSLDWFNQGPAYLTTIGLTNSLGATVTSNINIYDINNPANIVQPAVYTTAGTTTATGGLGNSRIFRVQFRTYDYNNYLNNVGQLRVADGGGGTSNFAGIIAEYRIYQQVATGLQVVEFIADYDFNTSTLEDSGFTLTTRLQYGSGEPPILNGEVRDAPAALNYGTMASSLMWSDARGMFLNYINDAVPSFISYGSLYADSVVMGGFTSILVGAWGTINAGAILQGTIATNTSGSIYGVAGYDAASTSILSSTLAGYEILPNAQPDNIPALGLGSQVIAVDTIAREYPAHELAGFGGAQTKFSDWLTRFPKYSGPRAAYMHTDTQDYTLDREITPGGRYWASLYVSVPPADVVDPEWTKRGIGMQVTTVNSDRDYLNVDSSTVARIMVPIAHSSVTLNSSVTGYTVQRSLVTSAIQSVRAIYTTAVLVRSSSVTTNFGNWWRVAMLFQAHSSLTNKTDALHVRLQTDSFANNVLTSSISTGYGLPPILVAGLQIAPAKTSQTWPPDYLSTVVPDTTLLVSPAISSQTTTLRASFSQIVAFNSKSFMRAGENVASLTNVTLDDTEWRLDNRDERSGRFVFTGGTTNQGRFMVMDALTNVTASTARVTFVAGDTYTVLKNTVDNNMDPPESGESLLLQRSTNGTSWVTVSTLFPGGDWANSGNPRTTSITYTTSVASNLTWRIAQTTHGSGFNDEYAVLVFETDNNQGTEASYPRFIDLQLREFFQLFDQTTADYRAGFPLSEVATSKHDLAYQPGIFDTFSRRVTSFLTPTGPGQMADLLLFSDDPIKEAYYYRTLPQFDQSSSDTIILDQVVLANLQFRSTEDFPGDLDPFGNINTLESRGQLRMTDYVADIEYLESDYVGVTRSIS